MAESGAERAAQLGGDPERVQVFLGHYFRHVDADDVVDRDVDDLLGLVASHYELALERPVGRSVVSVATPEAGAEGWSAGGATVIQIVTDDKPFLVDSVTSEVLAQGWAIREVFHPQFVVRRDITGKLYEVITHAEAEGDPNAVAESWMHLEVRRPPSGESLEALSERLTDRLRAVLTDVSESVADWPRMAERVADTMSELVAAGGDGPRAAEREQAIKLLDWLADDHFTFLGYRDYDFDGTGYTPVQGTGLGILRSDQAAAGRFGALPPADGPADLLVITKDDETATVHRPAYLDYVGIRRFDGDSVVGERRFLGLFAASAYSDSVLHIPVLKDKVDQIIAESGYERTSHGAMAILAALDNYPRDELFQTRADDLAPIIERISRLKDRRRVTVFSRPDAYGRFLSLLVYLPTDRYNTEVRKRMQHLLRDELGGESVDFSARVGEGVLARLHFVVRMPAGRPLGEVDVERLGDLLTAATRAWDDDLTDQLTGNAEADRLTALTGALPESYKEDFSARQAVQDLTAISALAPGEGEMSMALYAPDEPTDEADLRLKVFRRGDSIALSKVLPHLSLLGVDVLDEYPYTLRFDDGGKAMIYEFGLAVPGGAEAVAGPAWSPQARERFTEAFAASYNGRTEADPLNGLVTRAGLTWQEVSWLRGISRYLQQAGSTYSQSYIANALLAQSAIAADLVALFRARFDPDAPAADREAATAQITERISAALDEVVSLDSDRILRSFLAVIAATVRTNAFRPDRPALAFKVLPRELAMLPQPRPAYEIFVSAPQVEGVHLRFGPVARGGLRWSDRPEDFRTEVLGLVKAQMVKNTVIVPVGAKGGFYAKQLPDPAADRGAWFEAGKAAYRTFITSLLDVTDNIVGGEVVAPDRVVRYDGDDPYLVVAADKGTATFSDVANAIALERGFWLGDAFASGGSVGYDHKAMGITARGAWESVVRHFREMGIDCQNTDFTAVGVGDMSGDVFGNGMLLSKHIRLIAAFDHRHIFVDPDPDAASSWDERARMFELPRSSWADYDTSLISEGGGVFPRTAKSITITEQMRAALGIDDEVTALNPEELITAILKAPVDLLWNGGIGTYVKAEAETHAEVGDRANDAVRVNGAELRARAVGEGGNLGLTQRGRIEYARAGGRINTDFIDNSAGVDTSDNEVNIKILLSGEVEAGRLAEAERNELLASMTDEVADLVLDHNYDQNLALANAALYAPGMIQVHEDWMRRLERQGLIDRELESLPGTREMQRRRQAGEGLAAPELATLLAWTKIVLADEIGASDLPDDPYLADRLVQYFPQRLREGYADQMPRHRLAREIITTVAVNRFVNSAGISAYHRLSGETGARAADVFRAQLASRAIFAVGAHETRLRHLDNKVDAGLQTRARMELRALAERGTRWILNNRRAPIDVTAAIGQFRDGVAEIAAVLPDLLTGREQARYAERRQRYLDDGLPEELASVVAGSDVLYQSLGIVQTAQALGRDATEVARAHFALGQQLNLDLLGSRIAELPRDDRWATMARGALRDDLHQLHAQLTSEALQAADGGGPEAAVESWTRAHGDIDEDVSTLVAICDGPADLARVSVGLRIVRSLLRTPA
ncbi:glutamate dehydrogenase [Naumannella cuiyingiana]|uniref:Glutamate dehydrogenase n=1 Tax=Naumannella cuiyingiana TaxID=1347891 RepID=A0A7Z0D6V8_9ACTN|nr:NAD-glutamate dehydrogenase [Naumannella cuiyingiana]NYI69826.1 glutamate dehydrogenase [Naumannella cuiyingiana]